MKSNDNNRRHDRISHDRSKNKRDDDYDILDPSPYIDLNFHEEDDEDLSDYKLMDKAVDEDFEL